MSGAPANPAQLSVSPSFSPGPQQKEETRLRVQVSNEGGSAMDGLGLERLSVGGRESKAIPQRLETCHLRAWTLDRANMPAFPPRGQKFHHWSLYPLGLKQSSLTMPRRLESDEGTTQAAPSTTLRDLVDPQGLGSFCTVAAGFKPWNPLSSLEAPGARGSPAISTAPHPRASVH